MPELTKDESLARLARSYFRSHSPAVLQDFIWWSGLSVSDAKQAVYLIASELITNNGRNRHGIFMTSAGLVANCRGIYIFCLLYDEYLLGYKDRTDVLPLEHYSKAFTNNGLFFPIVLQTGRS